MRRALLTVLLAGAAALISLYPPPGALAAPGLALTSPAQDAVIVGGQPTFSGTAGIGLVDGPRIRVLVYSGASPTGTAVQTLTTSRSGTGFSVALKSPLTDGQYTADAEQSNQLGTFGPPSPAVTFTVRNSPPQITLDSPGSAPLPLSTPTLTGTAGTSYGDAASVSLIIYPGPDTSQAPVDFLGSSRDPTDGSFSIQISPGLPDGQYTAIAEQTGVAGVGMSAPQTFAIKANAPAVTLEDPAAGSRTTDVQPLFTGVAGNVIGDSAQVTLALYSDAGTNGAPIATVNVSRTGASWSARFPKPLADGQYTAQATQGDDVGHVGLSAPHTFEIVGAQTVIGSTVKLSHRTVSVSVQCVLATGQQCAGTVLILTVGRFRPVPEGPAGQLRVMFAYVGIPGGRTALISRRLPGQVARVLRQARKKIYVKVSAELSASGGSSATESAIRRLRRG